MAQGVVQAARTGGAPLAINIAVNPRAAKDPLRGSGQPIRRNPRSEQMKVFTELAVLFIDALSSRPSPARARQITIRGFSKTCRNIRPSGIRHNRAAA